jgi:hypothetical protein
VILLGREAGFFRSKPKKPLNSVNMLTMRGSLVGYAANKAEAAFMKPRPLTTLCLDKGQTALGPGGIEDPDVLMMENWFWNLLAAFKS